MPPNQPDSAHDTSGDTITVGNIVNSQAVAIGRGAVAQVFQRVLLPTPSDYRYAALRMIEEYEEIFGGREAELAALDTFLLRRVMRLESVPSPSAEMRLARYEIATNPQHEIRVL